MAGEPGNRIAHADRISAGLIGACALLSTLPPLANAAAKHGGLLIGLWRIVRFFTITTNLLVAAVFLGIAFKGRRAISHSLLSGLVLAIALVGIVFNLLLGANPFPTIWDMLANLFHHVLVPIAVPVWWLVFTDKTRLNWRAPLDWMLYPLAYSVYVTVRALVEGPGLAPRFPYYFMDADKLGWPLALGNMSLIALGFVAAGYGVVWFNNRAAGQS